MLKKSYIVQEGCLKELFTHIKPKKCPACHSKSIIMDGQVAGTSVMLQWVSSYLKMKINHQHFCHFYPSNELLVAFAKY